MYGCTGFVLGTPTWRASPFWIEQRFGSPNETSHINKLAVREALRLREEFEEETKLKIVVSGNVGPKCDCYNPAYFMTEEQAERYHRVQVHTRQSLCMVVSKL